MTNKIVAAWPDELADLRAFEQKHEAKYIGGTLGRCGRTICEMQPVASLDWCISTWNGTARLVEFRPDGTEETHDIEATPEWDALVEQVVEIDHNSTTATSSRFYPLSLQSLALYGHWNYDQLRAATARS
jgi:hypothetical protein